MRTRSIQRSALACLVATVSLCKPLWCQTVFVTYDDLFYHNNGVMAVDVGTGTTVSYLGVDFSHPHAIAIGPDGKLYIAFISWHYWQQYEYIVRMNQDGTQRETLITRNDWHIRGLRFLGPDLYVTTEYYANNYVAGVWKYPGVALVPYGGWILEGTFLWPFSQFFQYTVADIRFTQPS